MKIELNIEQLRGKKLFIATPMYGGQCHGTYTKSIADLMTTSTKYGIDAKLFFIFNESLITRARNYLADEFLRSGYDYLIFIDSDIQFEAQDVLVMSHYLTNNENMDIVCGAYPKKAISWEKIKLAVDKGFADKNPGQLEEFVGDYVFNPADGINQFRIDEPVEVKEGGTGFMMIKREAFLKFDEMFPEQKYKPDHVRTKNFDGSREIMAYFDTVIDPVSKRYLSEDYMFCQWLRKAGGNIWLLPWMKLKHAGSYIFGGSLQALASIGATPTADLSSPKK
jgi:glycosyltransferase involved in cell wall biosynthesis